MMKTVNIQLGWPTLRTSGKTNGASNEHVAAVRIAGSRKRGKNSYAIKKDKRIEPWFAFAAAPALLGSAVPAYADAADDDSGKRSLRGQQNETTRRQDASEVGKRGDVAPLPGPLKDRIVEMAGRPQTYVPQTVFSEVKGSGKNADVPSQLFQYYLLHTTGFQSNVFTAVIPGINDTAIPTAANAANGGRPTVGSVRVVLEPKPGLPTDPNDPSAFIDIFTDISGLFVIRLVRSSYTGALAVSPVIDGEFSCFQDFRSDLGKRLRSGAPLSPFGPENANAPTRCWINERNCTKAGIFLAQG